MSLFKKFYDRNDIPVTIGKNKQLKWKENIDELDLIFYLPLFVDGLQLEEEPYSSIAYLGIKDLIKCNCELYQILPSLIVPLKCALSRHKKTTLKKTFEILRLITKGTGANFTPYLRQVLPILNKHYTGVLHTEVEDTLVCFVEYGGREALQNIKYVIPTFDYLLEID